jgi:hypothetical protein
MEQKKVSIIHYIIVAAFCLLLRFVPGFAGITPLGMGILGAFIGAIYGWMTIDMLWPSLMALAGIGLSVGMNQMLAASFGNTAVVCLILCMGVIGISMKTGAFNWLVQVMLNNKFMQGKSWFAIWIILLAAWFMGCHNPIIMCIIFCAFADSIFKQVGLQKNDKLIIFMYLGIAYCLMMGQILFPFISTGLTLVMAYGAMFPDNPIDIVPYLLYMIVVGVAMTTVYVLLMRFVFRVDASPIATFKTEGGAPAATREQKISLAIFVLFVILMLAQSLPLGAIKTFLSQFGLVGLTLILSCVVALLKDSEGKPLCDLEQMFHMCNWGQITMVGFIMVCATYMNTQDTGISTAMASLIKPFMTLPPLVFIVVALAIGVILTNVANNMIVCVLIMPFLVNFGMQIGMAPTAMVALLFFMAQFAIATPAASPVTAVAMTQEMADASEMTKAALKIIPLLFLAGIIIGWPVAQIIF